MELPTAGQGRGMGVPTYSGIFGGNWGREVTSSVQGSGMEKGNSSGKKIEGNWSPGGKARLLDQNGLF